MATSKKSNGKKLRVQTSSVAATLVNLSVKQASGEVKKIRATCGPGYEKPLAHYDPNTQSWKMLEDISLWGDSPSLVNLPPSGMTRSGVLYLRQVWEPIIGETALLSWPTPLQSDWKPRGPNSKQQGLLETVKTRDNLWPTPTAVTRPMEGNVRLYRAKIKAGEMTEAEAEAILGKSVWEAQGKVKEIWPTPLASDSHYRLNGNSQSSRNLQAMAARGELEMWPTPRASSAMSEDIENIQMRMDNGETYKAKLEQAVAMWPTPTHGKLAGGSGAFQKIADLCSEGTISDEERKAMQAGNGGKLNPMWVEWLMGFPLGWTDLKDSETL